MSRKRPRPVPFKCGLGSATCREASFSLSSRGCEMTRQDDNHEGARLVPGT